MWTVEHLIGLGIWLSHELDLLPNVEIRILPSDAITDSHKLRLMRHDRTLIESGLPKRHVPIVEDVVELMRAGIGSEERTVWYAYSEVLNQLAIIPDG